jgi:hypothetical protein
MHHDTFFRNAFAVNWRDVSCRVTLVHDCRAVCDGDLRGWIQWSGPQRHRCACRFQAGGNARHRLSFFRLRRRIIRHPGTQGRLLLPARSSPRADRSSGSRHNRRGFMSRPDPRIRLAQIRAAAMFHGRISQAHGPISSMVTIRSTIAFCRMPFRSTFLG